MCSLLFWPTFTMAGSLLATGYLNAISVQHMTILATATTTKSQIKTFQQKMFGS